MSEHPFFCDICLENKESFITCKESEKHKWCLDCYGAMLKTDNEKCPYCRTNMRPAIWIYDYDMTLPRPSRRRLIQRPWTRRPPYIEEEQIQIPPPIGNQQLGSAPLDWMNPNDQ